MVADIDRLAGFNIELCYEIVCGYGKIIHIGLLCDFQYRDVGICVSLMIKPLRAIVDDMSWLAV